MNDDMWPEQPVPTSPEPNYMIDDETYELQLCNICNQMTNHWFGRCMKHDWKDVPTIPDSSKELEKVLYLYMNKHGNTLSQWKNDDYDYAQTFPATEQEELVPELVTTLESLIALAVQSGKIEELDDMDSHYWLDDDTDTLVDGIITPYLNERRAELEGTTLTNNKKGTNHA